ncbi:hypothetical protein Sste5346_004054 [Sporothrix stenoceras]|uniref:Protein BIG1 n=1 Tax=Sporothrix stenoceras TaxID=5173 RepID=A0ABR3Z9Q8_9PEZI
MRASILAGLLAVGTAHAFSDSSPFLLFSTADLPVEPSSQFQTSARVLASAKALLADCPTTKYLLVSQPNAHASDLYSPPSCEAHRLRRALSSNEVKGRFTVSEVVAPADKSNNLTLDAFSSHIKASCGADVTVNELSLPALPLAPTCQERAEALGDNDYVLGNALDGALALGDVTVVYFSNGNAAAHGSGYEATFEDPAQVPIKKRLAEHHNVRQAAPAASDKPKRDTRGLFEKYQFFTPGIFMSLIVFFILLTILYVGLSAVASLKVPYGAFDKDMGPSAQKKQQ